MKWFKHFSNAHDNNDLTKVRMKYGADGYAVYWYCLELIAGDLGATDAINFELRHDAEVIGFNLKIDSAKVEEIMRFMVTLGLFENSKGTVTCLKLAKYLDKKTTRNNTIHAIIDAASVSATIPDSLGTVPDKSGRSPLDIDTDRDIEVIEPNGSMSGKPDSARRILEFLNEKTGRAFRPTKTNLRLIQARMAEGYSEDECRMVVAQRARRWAKDEKMREYLRPATLFNAEKFNQYAGELTDV